MVGFQNKSCYNMGEELAPIEELRVELIEKIRTLPNEECKRIISVLDIKKG